MIYDVIIIGAGPAGMSAGIYSARSGLKTLVLESKMPGGLINYTNEVKNYPGFKNISGPIWRWPYTIILENTTSITKMKKS